MDGTARYSRLENSQSSAVPCAAPAAVVNGDYSVGSDRAWRLFFFLAVVGVITAAVALLFALYWIATHVRFV